MKKKLSLVLMVFVVASMMLSACAPQATPESKPETAPAAETSAPAAAAPTESKPAEAAPTQAEAPKDEPVKGGSVRFAIVEESRGLDPVLAMRRFSDSALHFYDSLVYRDVEGNYLPGLAEKWEVNSDATEFTFYLRKDVKFQDGTPLNAEAVKYHFDRVRGKDWCCANAYQYTGPNYKETEVVDEYTVKVKFSAPWGPFNYYMSMMDVTAIPSMKAAEEKGRDLNLSPVGSGPFKFVEWVPQSHIKAERNPDYAWAPEMFENKGAPYIDDLTIKFITDRSTLVACLESGDCDIVKDPNYTDLVRLKNDPAYKIDRIQQTGVPFSFTFNTVRWPTSELEVRKAINLAIDRERVSKAAFLGMRDPFYTVLAEATPEVWMGAKDLIYFKPEDATKVLTDAGWVDTDKDGILEKDGKPLELDMYVFGSQEANPSVIAAESMQADLKEIGMKVNIQVRPWDDQSLIAAKKEHNLINFDMPTPDASVLGVLFNSREAPREGSYGMGFSWFHEANPEAGAALDTLLNDGDNAPTLEARQQKYIEAQKIIAENYLFLPVAQGYTNYILNAKLQGVKYNLAGHAYFNDAWFSK